MTLNPHSIFGKTIKGVYGGYPTTFLTLFLALIFLVPVALLQIMSIPFLATLYISVLSMDGELKSWYKREQIESFFFSIEDEGIADRFVFFVCGCFLGACFAACLLFAVFIIWLLIQILLYNPFVVGIIYLVILTIVLLSFKLKKITWT